MVVHFLVARGTLAAFATLPTATRTAATRANESISQGRLDGMGAQTDVVTLLDWGSTLIS